MLGRDWERERSWGDEKPVNVRRSRDLLSCCRDRLNKQAQRRTIAHQKPGRLQWLQVTCFRGVVGKIARGAAPNIRASSQEIWPNLGAFGVINDGMR